MTINHPPQTRSRPAIRRRLAAVGCVLALGLGLGAAQADAIGLRGDATAAQDPNVRLPPPSVHLKSDSAGLALTPYVACWYGAHSGYCYDGIPPKPLPSLGGTSGPITLAFARDGWQFKVDVYDGSGHHTRLHLRALDERSWRLLTGDLEQGSYRADIFGKGPQGDVLVSATFTLT